jgi:hypothetical protein
MQSIIIYYISYDLIVHIQGNTGVLIFLFKFVLYL